MPTNNTRLTQEEITTIVDMVRQLGEPVVASRLGISGPTLVRACSPFDSKPNTVDTIRIALSTISPAAVAQEAARRALLHDSLVAQREAAKEAIRAAKRQEKLARKCGVFLNEIEVDKP